MLYLFGHKTLMGTLIYKGIPKCVTLIIVNVPDM